MDFFFHFLTLNDCFIQGSGHWEYFTTMWWLSKVFIPAWMSIGWRSINQVKYWPSVCWLFDWFTCENLLKLNYQLIFRTLAQHCHNIERLDLSDCKKITDQAIYAISKHCSKLTAISLESCVNITDKTLKNIADGCSVNLKVSRNCYTCSSFIFLFFKYFFRFWLAFRIYWR